MIILGTNSIKDTGYDVANSCRFDRASSTKLERTPSGAGNRRTFTFSCWFKLGNLPSSQSDYYQIFGGTTGGVNEGLFISDSDQFYLWMENTGALITNQKLRDSSAWYNVIMAVDTTNSTADNRLRLYLNGSEITSFGTRSNPTQNYDSAVNNTSVQNIGERQNDDYFDGYMAEVVMVDGQQLTPSSFGKFDSNSPTIWKPKDVSGLTFGTNGFYLDFEDSSSLGNDAAGSNNFTATNLAATDQATDTPTNNFATWNPLFGASNLSYAEGNAEISCSADGWFESGATIGISTGKWYFELKCTLGSGTYSSESIKFGTCDASRINDGSGEIQRAENHYQADGNSVNDDTISGVGTFPTFTTGDIVGCAVDMTNRKIYYHKNGTYINSGNPSSGSNGFDISSSFDFVLPAISMYESGTKGEVNFGNPSFSISSGNADADGYGNFEYSVPSGFYALCTKNLAEYG